jgi:hypothetical protein
MWDFLKELVITVRMFFLWLFRAKRSLKQTLEVGNKIDSILERLANDLGADRTYVFQFHNGQYFYSGVSIDKMTNTHEFAHKGISREQLISRDLMTSPFRKFIQGMYDNPIYDCADIEDLEDLNSVMWMESRGTKSFGIFLVKDALGRAIGFVGADFVKENVQMTTYCRERLKKASLAVYDLLMYGKTNKEQ